MALDQRTLDLIVRTVLTTAGLVSPAAAATLACSSSCRRAVRTLVDEVRDLHDTVLLVGEIAGIVEAELPHN